jgi:hypothetical protein
MTAPKGRAVAAAVPVVLVNAVAFAGQLAFLHEHLPWPLAGQVMMAVALESVAIYLAWHAHLAQLANDSALRLRLAAYAFALVIAACNYSHFAGPGWRPTFAAVAVGLCSAISPWLWSVYSRRASRDRLMASGLIEPHALRLGPTRWAWHPVRSAKVMSLATWDGITEPREAVTRWEAARRESASGSNGEGALPPSLSGAVRALPAGPGEDSPAPGGTLSPVGSAERASLPRRKRSTRTRGKRPGKTPRRRVTDSDAEIYFATDLAAGKQISARRIQTEMHVGWDRARELREHLESVLSATRT